MNYQNMSQLGKRSLQLLSGMLIVYGLYFARVLRNLGQSQFAGEALWSLIWAVVAVIGIEILYHVAAPPLESNPNRRTSATCSSNRRPIATDTSRTARARSW